MFFFKKKKVVVDAFTNESGFYEFGKPEKASKFLPNWWKRMPVTSNFVNDTGMVVERDTMRHCYGFVEHFSHGFVVPLWSDLIVETFEDGTFNYQYAQQLSPPITSHPASQMGYSLNDVIHLKINVPWRLQEKSGVKFVCIEPTWNYLDRDVTMNILPGIVDYQLNTSVNVNIILPKAEQTLNFYHGDPIYHIIPLSEHDLDLRTHLVSDEEYKKLDHWSGYVIKFRRNYLSKKKYLMGKPLQHCPFHPK